MGNGNVLAFVAVASLLTGPVYASNTFSGSYVAPSYEYDDIETGSGFKIAFDHRFYKVPVRLEAAYIDMDADVEGTSFVVGYEGLDLSLSFLVPANPGSDSSIWLGAGFYSGDATVEQGSFGFDESASGLSLGIGADWMPTPAFGFRFEYKVMVGMEDFANNKNLDVLSAGLVVAFGQDAPAKDRRRTQKSHSLESSPEASPTPPPPLLTVGDTVSIGHAGATLHQRDGQTEALTPGSRVQLLSTRDDGRYTWWWVRAGHREGWILQSEIEGQR